MADDAAGGELPVPPVPGAVLDDTHGRRDGVAAVLAVEDDPVDVVADEPGAEGVDGVAAPRGEVPHAAEGAAGARDEVVRRADAVVVLQVRHLAIVVGVTLLLAIVGFVALGNTAWGSGLSVAYPVALVGTAGGTANAARRVQQLAEQPPATRAAVPPVLAVAQTYLSPIIGGTFALLLYCMFLGGILQGEFFPDFACSLDDFLDYSSFSRCAPTTNGDAATALVWGFLAGFAERYVPNVLDRFVGGGDGDG